MKPGISRVRKMSAVAEVFIEVEEAAGSRATRRRSCGIVGIRKNESRITMTQPTRKSAWTMPRTPPIISSANVAFSNSACLW